MPKAKEIEICHVSNSYENECQYKDIITTSLHCTRKSIIMRDKFEELFFSRDIAAFVFLYFLVPSFFVLLFGNKLIL